MHTCPSCQDQMLEYLYDLLDEPERQAMQDHLDACAACRAELARARDHQQLLAAAARMEFPEVRFAPPAATGLPAVVARPSCSDAEAGEEGRAPGGAGPRPRRSCWSSAAFRHAGVLDARQRLQPRTWPIRTVAEEFKSKQVHAARQKMRDAVAQIQTLPGLEQEKIAEARDAVRARQLKMAVVVGQETVPSPGRRPGMKSRPPTSTISPSPPRSPPAWTAKTNSRSAIPSRSSRPPTADTRSRCRPTCRSSPTAG